MQAVVWLSRAAVDEISAEADHHYELETGGSFMGYWADDRAAVVTRVIPAGPNAHRSRRSFKPDQDWQLAAIAEHYARSDRRDTYLGDWHTHPNARAAVLSWTDKACLKAIIKTPKARTTLPIMMLVCGAPGGWSFHPKVCRLIRRYRVFEMIEATDASVATYE